jgi:multicomponent Na+:H+ antiporter subunit E
MSGVYKPLVIGLGAVSVIVAIFVAHRMNKVDGQPIQFHLKPIAFLGYFLWLLVEIAKANWAVTKVILSPKMRMRQHLFLVPYHQKSDLGQVIFANSITLTPGTISVEVTDGNFYVHAIDYSPDDDAAIADMGARICATESSAA